MTDEIRKVLTLVDEMEAERKLTRQVPHYYKRNGRMVRRSYDDTIETERFITLFHRTEGGIRGNRCFTCDSCGKSFDYFDIAWWCSSDEYTVCDECAEQEYGEDL